MSAFVDVPGFALGYQTDADWSRERTKGMPDAWAATLLAKWRTGHRESRREGNLRHLQACKSIRLAMRAGVPADSDDDALREAAKQSARDAERRMSRIDTLARAELDGGERSARLAMLAKVLEAMEWLGAQGLTERFLRRCRVGITGALARLCDDRWWRRSLRGIHAKAVEGTARTLGLVHKRAGCYVSDESARRRRSQRLANMRAIESVQAINEQGQAYTLAELAAKGTANKEVRRHELMTRIAGFELIAKECNHDAYFVTLTCPSSMHAWRTKRGGYGVEPNPHHDGTTPEEAQQHLSKQWGKFRAAADRAGLELYGFRIAEPNHDGTPHWHCLLFFPKVAVPPRGDGSARSARSNRGRTRPGYRVAVRLLRRYFLWQCRPEERGARHHRVEVKRIDWTKGSAAGYVAKYVAKNIDGYRVEKDLYGNDALTSSQRVEAWAATWRIRQFQQIGGAPVGIWRELRRLHPEAESACAGVGLALDAVNAGAQAPGDASEAVTRHTAATGWAAYLHLQGGHRVKRAALRLGLLREHTGEIGRYGECMPAKPVGVVTLDERRELVPAFGIVPATTRRRSVLVEVESERANWIIVPKGEGAGVHVPLHLAPARSEAVRPWSPVNNCTRPEDLAAAKWFAPAVERHKKRGRWHRWERKAPSTIAKPDGPGPFSESDDARSPDRQDNPREGWR